jgi:DNA-binding NtrC family response regulator
MIMVKKNILIVDDEPTQRKILGRLVSNLNYNCLLMSGGLEVVDFFMGKKVFKGISYHEVDVMLLDLSMPDIDGLSVLNQINPVKGDLQVIVLTANYDLSLAVRAINGGAIDYIVKGEKDIIVRLTASISNALEKKNLKYQVSHLARIQENRVVFSDIIGYSDALSNALRLAKKAANSTIPVLLEGPSGSGKEFLARAIHGSSLRAGKPFIAIECDLLKNDGEEILFGSERPVKDGMSRNIGKILEANNGTIFLEKVESLRIDLQLKLLRFMQEGEFTPPLGKSPVRANVRIISSTCRDLDKMIVTKKLREDFYYKISSFPINIASLKERGECDIKVLGESFCCDFAVSENKKIKAISAESFYLLYNDDWEDNIRQLKNSIFRAVVLCDGDFLKPEHFPQLLNKKTNNIARAKSVIKKNSEANSELIDIFDDTGRCKNIHVLEEEIIRRLLDVYNGNLSEVSKNLNIGRSTIYRKLKILTTTENIEDEES